MRRRQPPALERGPRAPRATCIDVTSSGPWPIATEIVSLGYQRAPRFSRAHSSDGTSPDFSKDEVDCRSARRTRSDVEISVMRSMPSCWPRL